MKKSLLSSLLIASLIFLPFTAMADLGDVIAKSKDIEIEMFGTLKTFPHFIENADFNDKNTAFDRIIDENGSMEDHAIRNEIRVGWSAKAKDWDFLLILEHDFNLNKVNVDRQTGVKSANGFESNSDTFGVEKLNFGYNFGPVKLNTGWNTKFLDLMTGGILYGDDHPYIGFEGAFGAHKWEALYLIIQDDIERQSSGALDGDTLDWRAYTFRVGFDLNGFTVAPMYAFSDNEERGADVHYLGIEAFGKLGIFTPRFEFIYATGDKKAVVGDDLDISAFGLYGSIEAGISKALNIYAGMYYLTGDDDKNDKDIEAFNGIGNIARYTPTFGMENAFIYRYVPALGTHVYANTFGTLGTAGSGYGEISNSATGDGPGLIMLGVGARGNITEQFSYKTQVMYFALAEEKNFKKVQLDPAGNPVKDANGKLVRTTEEVDDMAGVEFDLQLTYEFTPHFSIGNVLAVFFPGDFVEDWNGPGFDETAIMDTIELNWKF